MKTRILEPVSAAFLVFAAVPLALAALVSLPLVYAAIVLDNIALGLPSLYGLRKRTR